MVAWHAQVYERLGNLEAIGEDLGIAHLHAELGPLVLPADVLRAVCDRQVRQVWQVLEHDRHVEVRQQLCNFQREHLVSGCFELLRELVNAGITLLVLKQFLNSSLNKCLLETATMVLFFAIRQLFALLLPVEFIFHIPGRNSYWQLGINQFRD